MKKLFRSWKTTLIGGGALTAGLTHFIQTGDFKGAIPTLIIGLLGLLSKDFDVSNSENK